MDQSSARIQVPRAPPSSVKVWDNVAFESEMAHDDDLAPTVSIPNLRKQLSSQQRAAWASPEHASLRSSLPAETRRSQPGSPGGSGSWASPRPRSPAPGEGRVSQPGSRDTQPHRLSQMGCAPSPSSRVSAAGSEIYPLTQLFGRAASCSPTGSPTIQHLDDMVSNVSSINEDEEEGPTTTAGSRTTLPSTQDVLAWQSRITSLLSSSREEALRTPAPAGGLARFYITRHKGGLLGMQCTFRLFLEDGDVEVMSAVKSKQLAREGPTYTLYHAGESPSGRKDGSCVGIAQLAPNSTGTQYQLRALSHSPSPKSKSKPSPAPEPSSQLQLCISFEEQATRSELRSMHCLVPCDGGALPQGKDARGAPLAMLCTRQPDYDEVNGYTLPIDNRFFVTSIKNFQLVRLLGSGSRGAHTLLQFGRIAGNRFALDFAAPLTMKTAFATALAAMEAKYMNSSK